MNSKTPTDKRYTVVSAGSSTSALLFFTEENELEIYVGNQTDIGIEAKGLQFSGYIHDETFLKDIRKEHKLTHPYIEQGAKHYDVEEILQGEKIIACTVRSVHESHGKLLPNTITFAIESSMINSETLYPKALKWITDRTLAFSKILESEGMKPDSEFIINSFIYALDDDNRLFRFIEADRGKQTVTENMLT